jgi:pre-mRNA-splicing factor ATP-dependent RNA helicase DHX38/PRP16
VNPGEGILMPVEDENIKRQLDRDWYDQSEDAQCLDMSRIAESEVPPQKPIFNPKRISEKHLQNLKDTDKWEGTILSQTGIINSVKVYNPLEDQDHQISSVQLIVHEKYPPFIEDIFGKNPSEKDKFNTVKIESVSFDPIQPVKDPTSDMAQIARKGSQLVIEMKAKREQNKIMKKLVADDSSLLGNILGKRSEPEGEVSDSSPPPTIKPLISEQRRSLPIYSVRSQITRLISENPVVIIVGETGSGKTTQLTQFLFEEGFANYGMIGCTQPRRVAAMSISKRVSEEIGCVLGTTVGYAIRFEDCTCPKTKIKYMTDGVLLRECLRENEADSYSVIIIDEAHERSLQTDVLLGILREIITKRRDLKLIVTSATMDAQKFSSFFENAPIFQIPGRTFPVTITYSSGINEDYVDSCVKQAISIHTSFPPGDILIFMTGQEDIEATCDAIKDKYDKLVGVAQPLDVLPIYSQLPSDLQAKIFEPAAPGRRKCIVSTNIAETSLTVDGIVYVIDSGFCKIKVYNPRIGMDALQVFPISQAGANQRAGRAGRTGPGSCFRMYTEQAFFGQLFQNNIPEILRTNLSNAVLLLKSLGISDILRFKFIDSPPLDSLIAAMFHIWSLGAINDFGDLTVLGKKMVEFPLDPSLSKMLLVSNALGCVSEMLSIVAMLSIPQVFFRPKERAEESDVKREKFIFPESDHITFLNVFNHWSTIKFEKQDSWCADHFIHPKALKRAKDIRKQLEEIMIKMKIDVNLSCGRNLDVVRKCISSAYVSKSARSKGLGQYVNLRNGLPCCIHPTSSLFGLGYTPEYVVYHEIIMTSKEYMHCVTAVNPDWLAESGPAFYSLRISNPEGKGTLLSKQETKKILNFKNISTPLKNANLDDKIPASGKFDPKKKTHPIKKSLSHQKNHLLEEKDYW